MATDIFRPVGENDQVISVKFGHGPHAEFYDEFISVVQNGKFALHEEEAVILQDRTRVLASLPSR